MFLLQVLDPLQVHIAIIGTFKFIKLCSGEYMCGMNCELLVLLHDVVISYKLFCTRCSALVARHYCTQMALHVLHLEFIE